MHLFLCTVEHLDVDKAAIGAPSDVGQIALLVKVGDLTPYGRARGGVVDAERHSLRGKAVLGIFDILQRARASGDIEQRDKSSLTYSIFFPNRFLN